MPSSTRASDTGSALALPGPPPATPVRADPRPWYLDVWPQLLRRKPLGVVGGVIVLAMLAAALSAEVLSPYGFADTSLRERLQPASAAHWLGTDHLGRDLLTRILYGARISLYVGFGAIALGAGLATLIGVGSAYFGGRVDLWAQRGVDAWMAFPGLLLLMTILSLLGPSVLNITLVLGPAAFFISARSVRVVASSGRPIRRLGRTGRADPASR